ncbi:MAG TPA: hypothetical protein DD379_22435 [Cyanobacteria bacterium UBA11162]|nr:hypothetical protein [Cyanobacteria bacterium UBA11370]HBL14095.1 hypothetical protein [Cyanobacteria bacterium UBA11162]HBY78732.1 hypothetical protein [Cyanobacteria bacterium UBA11148]
MQNAPDTIFFVNRYVTVERTFSETEPSKSPSNEVAFPEQLLSTGGLLLLPLGFLGVGWIIWYVAQRSVWKTFPSQLLPIKRFRKIPCSNCKFFNSNPFLKCAVHPSKVLSTAAHDCSDYLPHEGQQLPHSSEEI